MQTPPVNLSLSSPLRLLYDTGPVPLFVRLGTLPFAALCVVVGYKLLREEAARLGSGQSLLGLVALALLLLLFVQLWFWRSWLFFDGAQQALVQRHRGLFGASNRRTAAREVAQVLVRPGHLRASQFWDVALVLTSGRRCWLTRIHQEPQAQRLAQVLAETLDLPAAAGLARDAATQ